MKRLASKEHSAALAQIASRIFAIMKFRAGAGEEPVVKVKALVTDLLNKLQAEPRLRQVSNPIAMKRRRRGPRFCATATNHSSHPYCTALCLIHCCLRTSQLRFLHLHVARLLFSLVYPSVSPLPLCKHGYALADGLDNHLSQIWRSPSHQGASSFSPQESTHLENGPWVPDGRTRRNFNMPRCLLISPAVVVASTFNCSTW